MTTPSPFRLTPAEIEQYHRDGFVVPSGFRLPKATLNRIMQWHTDLLLRHPEFADYCPGLLPLDLAFLNVAREPNIVSAVTQLIGPDVALWNSSFFAKPANTGRRVPFHQDGQYWCIRPLSTCTVWIAIDRSHRGNGCLRVIPGSHKSRTLENHITHSDPKNLALQQEADPASFDPKRAVDLVLEPGQISLHDVYLIHGSEANTSNESRRGMTLRFMPTSSLYDRTLGPAFKAVSKLPLFLIAGKDRYCGNDFALMPASAKKSNDSRIMSGTIEGTAPVGMSSAQAAGITQAAIGCCREHGFRPVTVCVVDAAGHTVVLQRMDGCSPVGIPAFAKAKALTCIAMKLSSRGVGVKYAHPTKLAQLTSMVAITGGQFAAFPGGVLITTAQGSVVGAVGVSGARADEDELCAVLGVHRGGLGLVTGTPPPSL